MICDFPLITSIFCSKKSFLIIESPNTETKELSTSKSIEGDIVSELANNAKYDKFNDDYLLL